MFLRSHYKGAILFVVFHFKQRFLRPTIAHGWGQITAYSACVMNTFR